MVEKLPDSDLREPRNDEDVYVILEIQFLISTEYSHLSDARDLYGSRNTWLCLFWLGPSSFEMTILKTSHVVLRIRLEILRPSRG